MSSAAMWDTAAFIHHSRMGSIKLPATLMIAQIGRGSNALAQHKERRNGHALLIEILTTIAHRKVIAKAITKLAFILSFTRPTIDIPKCLQHRNTTPRAPLPRAQSLDDGHKLELRLQRRKNGWPDTLSCWATMSAGQSTCCVLGICSTAATISFLPIPLLWSWECVWTRERANEANREQKFTRKPELDAKHPIIPAATSCSMACRAS